MRNPAIYSAPYRINQSTSVEQGELSQPSGASIEQGLEPGDLTKYSAVPWQSDFNECTNQPIDTTYLEWNSIEPDRTGDPVVPTSQLTYWWPVHRPVFFGTPTQPALPWSPTAQNNAGDLAMVTAWASLRFIVLTTDKNGNVFFDFEPSDQPPLTS
jgi:hypothetical protein